MRSRLKASQAVEAPSSEEICGICLEKMSKPLELQCKHSFCLSCIEQYQKYNPTARCPNCRANLPIDIHLHNASIFTQRAVNHPEGSTTRAGLLQDALAELEKIIVEKDQPCRLHTEVHVYYNALSLKAEVLFFQGDFDRAVDIYSAILRADLSPSDRTAIQLHIAKCRHSQGRPAAACAAYAAAMREITQEDLRLRELLAGWSACMVESGKDLPHACRTAEDAISMNRYYPGAYDALVAAGRRTGDLAAAAVAAQRAVLYETPWDDANRAAVLARAAECVAAWAAAGGVVGAPSVARRLGGWLARLFAAVMARWRLWALRLIGQLRNPA